MPQKPKHTAPPPNSQAAAYGYVGSLASHSVTLSHTMTEPGYKPYSNSINKALYVTSSKTDYTYLACRQAGFGPAAPRIPSHSKRITNKAPKKPKASENTLGLLY